MNECQPVCSLMLASLRRFEIAFEIHKYAFAYESDKQS